MTWCMVTSLSSCEPYKDVVWGVNDIVSKVSININTKSWLLLYSLHHLR